MNASKLKTLSTAAAAAIAIAGLGVAVQAGPNPPFQTGFELTPGPSDNPSVSYTAASNLTGQNGWTNFSGLASQATVQSGVGNPNNGVQMIANGAGPGTYLDYYTTATTYAPLPASFQNVVDIGFDLKRQTGGTRSGGFGIDILSSGNLSGSLGDHILASLFIGNATDNSPAMIVTNGTDAAASVYGGFARNDNNWGTYHIRLDFNNNTFTVFAQGNNVAAGPFALNAAAVAEGGIGGIAFASTNDGTDTAFFDNLAVVPEPASIAMVGLGSLLILAKRPKHQLTKS